MKNLLLALTLIFTSNSWAQELTRVGIIKDAADQYVLRQECQRRNDCEVKEGCFIAENKDENRFLVFCKADYKVVKSYPPGN